MKTTGIYKITSPSGKVYIGQSVNIELRWNKYVKFVESCKAQTKLYNSFKKYGPKNHTFEIIEECNDYLLLEKETYWKIFYKVLEIPSLCCRLDGKGGSLSKETKDKISKSSLGISRNKGRIQSKEEKQLRTIIKKGYKPTKDHIYNMSKSMLGKNTKSIECINSGEIFKSINEAAKKYNLRPSSIDNILSGKASQTRKQKLKFKYY
jgi:group I intron endonuclease